MADTTGGEIPSSEGSSGRKETAMCDSQSDVERPAPTNGTSGGEATRMREGEVEATSEGESGAREGETTTAGGEVVAGPGVRREQPQVSTSADRCIVSSWSEENKDDKLRPQSPLVVSSFSVCSPLFTTSRCSSSQSSASPSSSGGARPRLPANSSMSPSSSGGARPRLLANSSAVPSPASRPLVLRPSQLGGGGGGSGSSASPFKLQAPKLLSPFASSETNECAQEQNSAEAEPLCAPEKAIPITSNEVSSNSLQVISENVTSSTSSPTRTAVATPSSSVDTTTTHSATPSSSAATPTTSAGAAHSAATPTPSLSFVPLSAPAPKAGVGGGEGSGVASSAAGSTASRFVFGQNLHERVIVESSTLDTAASSSSASASVSNNGEASCSSASTATTNGTSEMLFSSVIQKELPDKSTENSEDKNRKSLSEAAREYEESRAIKRKYEEVAVVTGEEEENNILQMDCKLFVYDNNKLNYSEGVHGMLRVNDPPSSGAAKRATNAHAQSSRVIVRMSGSLRVLLNTKIWADMKIEKPNRKIVRMTAMDTNGQIKIFLISSSPSESEMLFKVLDARIKQQKETALTCQNGNGNEEKTGEPEECTSSSPS
ncbi:ran-binding protein 3 isoform X2 [Nilaparvata lugens]|uniref:ran-binding protein 3 isoform X2 n=1 Tax=Nilaparvata lugens TaxID=108931 RepID=UPI00193EC000|nr:ran-binding protein 3 isoform X2 [Nilaparvata lugens]